MALMPLAMIRSLHTQSSAHQDSFAETGSPKAKITASSQQDQKQTTTKTPPKNISQEVICLALRDSTSNLNIVDGWK